MKIPVGIASYVGYGFGIVQVLGALVLWLEGDHVAAGALLGAANAQGIVSGAGRYLQAHKAIGVVTREAAGLPAALEALAAEAEANVAKVQASPDGVQSAGIPYSGAPPQGGVPSWPMPTQATQDPPLPPPQTQA